MCVYLLFLFLHTIHPFHSFTYIYFLYIYTHLISESLHYHIILSDYILLQRHQMLVKLIKYKK